MPERGGPTIQSGILYQNSITARYLGRMLNKYYFPPNERVTSVRGEAPEYVDDVVVTFEDSHRMFIQAKVRLTPGSSPWNKLWQDFSKQRKEDDFRKDDRLVLFLGETIDNKRELDELIDRARGANDPAEWMERIKTKDSVYVKELEKLRALFPIEQRDDESVWRLMRVVEIRVEDWKQLEDNSYNWMPPSSANNVLLFTVLRDLSGEKARIKGSFKESELRRWLENKHDIRIDIRRADVDGVRQPLASEELSDLEEKYRQRIKERFAGEADYYVPLAGETTEATKLLDERKSKAPRSARRIRKRAEAEYHEWITADREIKKVRLNNLREGVDKYPCMILLGDPGSGKTTALENLAYQFADDPNFLPLPLRLSEFKAGISLEEFILLGWGGTPEANHWGMPELAANLKRYLEEGKLFFLFDALNEMPQEEYSKHTQELRRFIDQWIPKGNRFMVTCRVLDYGEELSGLQRVEIRPLTNNQIQDFLTKELPEDWHDLWRELVQKESRLLEMARNPYLLTMMIDVYFNKGELYQKRAALMTRFTQILMEWAKEKTQPEQWLDAEVLVESLAVLAYEMLDRSGSGSAVMTSLVKTIMPQVVQINPNYPSIPLHPDQVLNLAASANIIELPADRSTVRFYHQLLQEYFAAVYLRNQLKIKKSFDWVIGNRIIPSDRYPNAWERVKYWYYPWLEVLLMLSEIYDDPLELIEWASDRSFKTTLDNSDNEIPFLVYNMAVRNQLFYDEQIRKVVIETLVDGLTKTDYPDDYIDLLMKFGKESIRALIKTLHDEHFIKRITPFVGIDTVSWIEEWDITFALGEFGELAIEPLIKSLENTNDYIRLTSVVVLGEIGGPSAIQALSSRLIDENQQIRNNARIAIGKIIDRSFENPTELFRDPDILNVIESNMLPSEVNSSLKAIYFLLSLPADTYEKRIESFLQPLPIDSQTIEALVFFLGFPDPDIQVNAVQMLKHVIDSLTIKYLLFAMTDNDAIVRWRVEEILKDLNKQLVFHWLTDLSSDPEVSIDQVITALRIIDPLKASEIENDLIVEDEIDQVDE